MLDTSPMWIKNHWKLTKFISIAVPATCKGSTSSCPLQHRMPCSLFVWKSDRARDQKALSSAGSFSTFLQIEELWQTKAISQDTSQFSQAGGRDPANCTVPCDLSERSILEQNLSLTPGAAVLGPRFQGGCSQPYGLPFTSRSFAGTMCTSDGRLLFLPIVQDATIVQMSTIQNGKSQTFMPQHWLRNGFAFLFWSWQCSLSGSYLIICVSQELIVHQHTLMVYCLPFYARQVHINQSTACTLHLCWFFSIPISWHCFHSSSWRTEIRGGAQALALSFQVMWVWVQSGSADPSAEEDCHFPTASSFSIALEFFSTQFTKRKRERERREKESSINKVEESLQQWPKLSGMSWPQSCSHEDTGYQRFKAKTSPTFQGISRE